MEIEILDEPRHVATDDALTVLHHALVATRAKSLKELLPIPSLVDVMRLNMISPCVLTTLRSPSLGWMQTEEKPTCIEFSGDHPIFHDALLMGQLFALSARNISWLYAPPSAPLSAQKVYCKPSDADEFMQDYIQGLALALHANNDTNGKDSPHNWTLEREMFMLAVGVRAFLDGFVSNHSEAVLAAFHSKAARANVNVRLERLPVPGSFHIPNIHSAHLCASSADELDKLSELRELCRHAVRKLRLTKIGNERIVEYDERFKGKYEAIIAQHLSFLLNKINRYFLLKIPAVSVASTSSASVASTSSASVAATSTVAKREKTGSTGSTEISPEPAVKRPRTLCRGVDDVDVKAFCNGEIKFRKDMNEAFNTESFKNGEAVDIDCVIDGVNFLMHKDIESAPEAEFMRINTDCVQSQNFIHIGGFSKSQSRCNIVVAPKRGHEDQLGWLQKLVPSNVPLADVAIRIPRLNRDSVESIDCTLNVISQYHSGGVAGVGPKLLGVVFFQAQQAFELAPRSSKKPAPRIVPVMIVERIKGKTLFEVLNDDVHVRIVLLSQLFDKMTHVNSYNLDSKEMNIMLKEDRSALVFVDWDSAWSGFLIDSPTRSTRGVNFHFYTFNMLIYVQRRLDPSHASTNARLSVLTDLYTRFRAKNSDFTGSPMMNSEWKGLDVIIPDTGGFIGAKTPMTNAMHAAQMFVQRVGVDATRDDLYEACRKNLSAKSMQLKVDFFLTTSGVMRFFLKRRNSESFGEVLKEFNNLHLDVNARAPLPLACAREEVQKAIADNDWAELRSCLGFVRNGAKVHGW